MLSDMVGVCEVGGGGGIEVGGRNTLSHSMQHCMCSVID